jgi:uncharacterized protein
MKKYLLTGIVSLLLFSGCAGQSSTPAEKPENPSPLPPQSGAGNNQPPASIANPAAVNCKEKGYQWEVRTGPEGGQIGYCLSKGKECEEWALFRGSCSLE